MASFDCRKLISDSAKHQRSAEMRQNRRRVTSDAKLEFFQQVIGLALMKTQNEKVGLLIIDETADDSS